MVTVRDDQLLVFHRVQHFCNEHRVGKLPHAMQYVVLIGDLEVRLAGFAILRVEDQVLGGECGIGVEHINLFAIRPCSLEQAHAIGFVLRERLLMAIDHMLVVVIEMAKSNKTAAFACLVCARHLVGLRVSVKRRLSVLAENAF
jgi:hypothetical protein